MWPKGRTSRARRTSRTKQRGAVIHNLPFRRPDGPSDRPEATQRASRTRTRGLRSASIGVPFGPWAFAQGTAERIGNSVGNKAAVLSAVVDLVAAGPQAPTSVRTFMQARTHATHTLTELVALLAEWFADVHPRLADVFRLIRQAAAIDPDVQALELDRAGQRLNNYCLAADQVRALGG